MAEILGPGCSHGPIILTPPEVWARGRERVFARIANYQPPVGTNHFAWEMVSFEALQAMYRPLKAKGVQILRTREHTPSVGVSCTAPDGYRQSWEGQYTRKLQAA
jgi:hypothetical protein